MTAEIVPVERAEIEQRPLSQNPAAVYLASLSAGSRETMGQSLDRIANLAGFDSWQSCPWAALRYQHTTAIRSRLQELYAPATANKMLAALRRTLKEAWRLEQMSAEEYQRAADLEPIRGERPPAATGRMLAYREIVALLEACADDPTPAGARDAAILALGYTCGLRRAEFVALDTSHYDAHTHTLTVSGKGNKVRVLPVEGGTVAALEDWLSVRGAWAGPLFVRIVKGGRLTHDRLTHNAIRHILAERAGQAGVEAFSPHDLRRTFISDLLDAVGDVVTVQALAGHSNPSTTAKYDRRGERVKRDAVARLKLPYRRRARE